MESVFIVFEYDSNDESRILRVFSDESKALAFNKESLDFGCYSHVWLEEWKVWK